MASQVATENAPSAEAVLSQAIATDSLIFVSGQVHSKPNGELVQGSTKEKVIQIMENISVILEAAGSDLSKIVKATIHVTDMSLMPELNDVYTAYLSKPYPAREAICVNALLLGADIEIGVIATK